MQVVLVGCAVSVLLYIGSQWPLAFHYTYVWLLELVAVSMVLANQVSVTMSVSTECMAVAAPAFRWQLFCPIISTHHNGYSPLGGTL